MFRLKSAALLLFFSALLLSIGGCKSDDGGSPTETETASLVGTWVLTKITVPSGGASLEMTPAQAQVESTIIAKADGTYTATIVMQGISSTEIGTWSTDGKKITFKLQDGTTRISDYTLTGNKLVVSQTIPTPLGPETPANLEFTKQ